MPEQIIKCSIQKQTIKCQIKENIIKVKIIGGGSSGISDHSLLSNLDYDHAGHVDFQKKLNYISEYKAYEIPN